MLSTSTNVCFCPVQSLAYRLQHQLHSLCFILLQRKDGSAFLFGLYFGFLLSCSFGVFPILFLSLVIFNFPAPSPLFLPIYSPSLAPVFVCSVSPLAWTARSLRSIIQSTKRGRNAISCSVINRNIDCEMNLQITGELFLFSCLFIYSYSSSFYVEPLILRRWRRWVNMSGEERQTVKGNEHGRSFMCHQPWQVMPWYLRPGHFTKAKPLPIPISTGYWPIL